MTGDTGLAGLSRLLEASSVCLIFVVESDGIATAGRRLPDRPLTLRMMPQHLGAVWGRSHRAESPESKYLADWGQERAGNPGSVRPGKLTKGGAKAAKARSDMNDTA